MAASFIIGILAKIPWKEILKYGPVIIDTASNLLSKNRSAKIGPADTVEIRIARLEQNEKDQAELIKSMAERQEILVHSIQVLNARLNISLLIAVLLVIGFIYILFR
ncbi:MAG: hypothetical protein AABZ15_00030 [Nitrospirota bacterium]